MLLSWAAIDRLCDLENTCNFSGPSVPVMSSWGVGVHQWFLPRDTRVISSREIVPIQGLWVPPVEIPPQ